MAAKARVSERRRGDALKDLPGGRGKLPKPPVLGGAMRKLLMRAGSGPDLQTLVPPDPTVTSTQLHELWESRHPWAKAVVVAHPAIDDALVEKAMEECPPRGCTEFSSTIDWEYDVRVFWLLAQNRALSTKAQALVQDGMYCDLRHERGNGEELARWLALAPSERRRRNEALLADESRQEAAAEHDLEKGLEMAKASRMARGRKLRPWRYEDEWETDACFLSESLDDASVPSGRSIVAVIDPDSFESFSGVFWFSTPEDLAEVTCFCLTNSYGSNGINGQVERDDRRLLAYDALRTAVRKVPRSMLSKDRAVAAAVRQVNGLLKDRADSCIVLLGTVKDLERGHSLPATNLRESFWESMEDEFGDDDEPASKRPPSGLISQRRAEAFREWLAQHKDPHGQG